VSDDTTGKTLSEPACTACCIYFEISGGDWGSLVERPRRETTIGALVVTNLSVCLVREAAVDLKFEGGGYVG